MANYLSEHQYSLSRLLCIILFGGEQLPLLYTFSQTKEIQTPSVMVYCITLWTFAAIVATISDSDQEQSSELTPRKI